MKNFADTDLLVQRADQIEKNIEEYFVDDSGKIRSAINFETMKPFEPGFFDDKNHLTVVGYEDMDYADFVVHENVGMVTGAFLAAMCWKYKATGDLTALEKARRSYNAIKKLYELSQAIAPGFYCKCWGDRVTDELSSDQYIYSMTGLDLYSEFANPAEKDEIAKMIGAMARFWKERDYVYKYYGRPLQWMRCRFTGFMALAYHHTGDKEFLDELNRLLALDEVRKDVPFCGDFHYLLNRIRNTPPADFEKNLPQNIRVTTLNSEQSESGFLSIEPVLRFKLDEPEFYLNMAARMLDYGKRGVAPDGSGYHRVYINLKTEEVKELDVVIQEGNMDIKGWKFFNHIAPLRHGTMATCMFARAAVGIHRYLPDLGGLKVAMDILSKVTPDHMTWFEDPTGALPEDLKWMTAYCNGDAITHWLWAYWEAKAIR